VAGVCVYGYGLLLKRADLPLAALSSAPGGERVVRVDGLDLQTPEDLEYALAFKKIGQPTRLSLRAEDGSEREITTAAVPYYSRAAYPLAYLLVGLFSAGLGTATFLLKPADRKARLFFFLSLAFGTTVAIQGESYGLQGGRWLTFLPGAIFIFGYAFVPAFFLHLSLAFSPSGRLLRPGFLYLPAAFSAALLSASFLAAFATPSVEAFRLGIRFYPWFRLYIVAFALAAVLMLVRALRRSADEKSRAQVKWLFFGLATGLAPFLFAYMIPRAFNRPPVFSEELTAFGFILVPLSFAMAIVRHRFLDVDIIINRGLVYSLLTAFTVGLYLLVVEVAGRGLIRLVPVGRGAVTAAGVFLAAAAFRPAQRRIQDLIDRAFFRQRFDYRQTVFEFNERACRFVRREDLLDHFSAAVRRVLPVESLALAFPEGSAEGGPESESLVLEEGAAVLSRPNVVREDVPADLSRPKKLADLGAELALPVSLAPESPAAWLSLGKKKSGGRFSREDVELLRTMANELAVNLERLRLLEEVAYERASREKLAELNRLKTEFISSVSHELRTPMSSIQGLAEILHSGKIKSRDQRERYLQLMVSESGRLSRFLHNILDLGRIESGTKSYRLARTDLRTLVRDVAESFGFRAENGRRLVEADGPETPVWAEVDEDAVKQAVINLVDNGLKYSTGEEAVRVGLRPLEGGAEVAVIDRGVGIAPEDLEKLFTPFFRGETASRLAPKGAGLGLRIVKHIMDAHGGSVRVESLPGKGSTFRLIFGEKRP